MKPQPELLYSISGWPEKEIHNTSVAFQEILKHLPYLMSFAKDIFNSLGSLLRRSNRATK